MTTLATNLIAKATSQFRNYDFNGYFKAYGQKFGVNENGLFILSGDTDNGITRTASITLSNKTFGNLAEKRFQYFYIELYTENDFRITYITDDIEAQTQFVPIKKPGLQVIRIPCSRICRGVAWSIRIDSINNNFMRLYSIKGLPTIMHAARSIR